MPADPRRLQHLTFDGFKDLARDPGLTWHEKIGFPDTYREGKTEAILRDIRSKLPRLDDTGKLIVDIGPGCGELAFQLIDHCRARTHRLVLVDSEEMLSHLPDAPFITKVTGRFPDACRAGLGAYEHSVDAIVAYSVVQYVFAEANVFDFVDSALGLLAEGGALLVGDVPNVSKRNRFFASATGVRFHQTFTGQSDVPEVAFSGLRPGVIDDAAIVGLLLRGRTAGFDAYVLPQAADAPMENRREDLLFRRP